MLQAEKDLQHIVHLYRTGKKIEALVTASLYWSSPHEKSNLYKALYYQNYFYDCKLFDLSIYFLIHCERDERRTFLEEWQESAIDHFTEDQRTSLKRLLNIYCRH